MSKGVNILRIDDQVEVIAGKDKGRVGKIIKIFKKTDKALVEKINMIKKHQKQDMKNQQSAIIEKEAPIHVSNLMLICLKCTKTVRAGMKILEDGSKVRVCKKCGEVIEPKA
ncbi:MAG: 50S ribosomal protein L24 [Thermodesulfobacteriota bacterium]|nr:50S ribosomal protein L24 [Thermodesulfobacteriota bacterium]